MNKLIFFAVSLIFLFTLYRCCSPDQPQKPTEFKRAVLKFNKTDGFIYEGMFDTSKYFRIAGGSEGTITEAKEARKRGSDTIIEGDLVAEVKTIMKQMDLVVKQRDAYRVLVDSLLITLDLERGIRGRVVDCPLEIRKSDTSKREGFKRNPWSITLEQRHGEYERTGIVRGYIEDVPLDTTNLRRPNAYEIWKQEQYNTDPK